MFISPGATKGLKLKRMPCITLNDIAWSQQIRRCITVGYCAPDNLHAKLASGLFRISGGVETFRENMRGNGAVANMFRLERSFVISATEEGLVEIHLRAPT